MIGQEGDMAISVWRKTGSRYPDIAPFHPSGVYPESVFEETGQEANTVYEGLRELFMLHGLDAANSGSKSWNPLGAVVNPGDTVLLKPNLIKENHPILEDGWRALITHGSVIRAVSDYVVKALDGRGRIIVADAPQTDSSFDAICDVLKLREIREFYRSKGVDFELVDLRRFEWKSVDDVVVSRRELPGDPEGYVTFDLADRSLFKGFVGEGRYYGADHDTTAVNEHHYASKHEYIVSGSAIKCDVFINLPKLKTHKKAGVTLSLKNLVGINGDKNYLPHYTHGAIESGGDQFPDDTVMHGLETSGLRALRRIAVSVPVIGPKAYIKAKKLGQRLFGRTTDVVRSGNWYGNDTVWRMCLDLNRILLYGRGDGSFGQPAKRYLSIIDGIVAGEGDGPIWVDPIPTGLLILGDDPACTDAVAATLMGCDPLKLRIIRNAFKPDDLPITRYSLDSIDVLSNVEAWARPLGRIDRSTLLNFRAHFGWRDHIEIEGH
jgi:uncharacterized protein (DUF362 family)